MDRDLFTDTILAYKRRRPFHPFTVAMVDGDKLEVDFPDALAVRDGLAIYAGPGRIPHIFDNEGVSRIIGDLANPGTEGAAGASTPAAG